VASTHAVCVSPLPVWLDWARLLGPAASASGGQASGGQASGGQGFGAEGWALTEVPGGLEARAVLSSTAAADLGARLRGLGFDGHLLRCEVDPPVRRAVVRAARSEDARRRRVGSPGFRRKGARLDQEGRWSLTPEALALALAAEAAGVRVVDAGCGAGGNAIAFARRGCAVLAIEADRERLELARHNAGLYGVRDRIRFVHGDAIVLVPTFADPSALLFIDPPWGPDYDRRSCGLDSLPLLAALLPLAYEGGALGRPRFGRLWIKLPPSFDTGTLPKAKHRRVRAVFGEASGDRRRVKFLLASGRLPGGG